MSDNEKPKKPYYTTYQDNINYLFAEYISRALNSRDPVLALFGSEAEEFLKHFKEILKTRDKLYTMD